ncbi:MAG: DUF2268 domain-containing putative Zn-dependent protease [Candidatus Zixiibacteriota bacterium]
MRIIDFTDRYLQYAGGKISRAEYEQSCPELFEQYRLFNIAENWEYKSLSADDIKQGVDIIMDELSFIERRFRTDGFDLTDLELLLFVGGGSTNGHAVELDGRMAVWLPVETYTSPMLARVFIAHEIIHALHYTSRPEFRFTTSHKLLDFERSLITEGIATFLTAEILGMPLVDALWADHLPAEDAKRWMDTCNAKKRELLNYCLDHIDSKEQEPAFFRADNPGDIYEYRAGYYIGAMIARTIYIADNLMPQRLLSLDRKTIIEMMRRM